MLIITKATLAIMIGFIMALIAGFTLIPPLKKLNFRQNVSKTVGKRHLIKEGTPTIGGIIFIIPTILALVLLYFRGSIGISSNLIILIMVFLSYAALGFVDDFLIKTTSYSMARINEHKILTSKEIKDFVQNNFLLTNYRGL